MALSDHERKLLAEMEAALEQEDPKLLSTLTGKARTRQGSRALLGFSILVVGLLVLISGLIAKALYLALNLDRVLIRLVGVSLDSLVENDDVTQMVLGERTSSWQQADRAIDRVKAKFGRSSLRPARLVDDKVDEQDED